MNKRQVLAKIGGLVATAALVAGVAKLGYIMSPEEIGVVKVFLQSIILGM